MDTVEQRCNFMGFSKNFISPVFHEHRLAIVKLQTWIASLPDDRLEIGFYRFVFFRAGRRAFAQQAAQQEAIEEMHFPGVDTKR